jgi:hypothetical protein
LDTLLFHQRFCLRLCLHGYSRLAAFDPHGGLNGLDDFPVDSGCGLHASPQELTRRFGARLKQIAVAGVNKIILTSIPENTNAKKRFHSNTYECFGQKEPSRNVFAFHAHC